MNVPLLDLVAQYDGIKDEVLRGGPGGDSLIVFFDFLFFDDIFFF